jgi:nitrogen fixation protein FixH
MSQGIFAPDPADAAAGRRLARRLVGGILGVTALVHLVALAYTSHATPELVRTDYYEAGEAHEAELAARRRAEGLGLRLDVRAGAGLTGANVIELSAAAPTAGRLDLARPARVGLYRPGRQALDREVELWPVEAEASEAVARAALWRAETAPLARGRWRARASLAAADGATIAAEWSFEVE